MMWFFKMVLLSREPVRREETGATMQKEGEALLKTG